ncbi:MAG: sigma-70 family RNA polymerase sigma factor [Clostridia bacterium]|nr:sigma-70 family RNA polymerase sigma factor [Clostridia bacterium]
MENKKFYWIIDGKYYEVSNETYLKYKKDYDHSKRLKEYEAEVTVLSLDKVITNELDLSEVLPDPSVNVEDSAINSILLEKMRKERNKLSLDEKLLLELLFERGKSQEEAAKITGIPQSTISYRLERILKKLRKAMGLNKKI